MTDRTELKRLAEACPQVDPLRLVEYHGAWYLRNTAGIVLDVHRNRCFPEFMAQNEAYARLVEAASPTAILALLAENEQLKHDVAAGSAREWDLRSQVRSAKESRARVVQSNKAAREERDQLKHDHDKWESLYRNEHTTGTRLLDTLTGFRTERDQLKSDLEVANIACQISIAENIGLKGEVARSTEREILQLAEIEGLRKKVGRARVVGIPSRDDPKYWDDCAYDESHEGGPVFHGSLYANDLLAALKADGITASEVAP